MYSDAPFPSLRKSCCGEQCQWSEAAALVTQLITVLAQAPHLVTDCFRFVGGSGSGDHTRSSPEGADAADVSTMFPVLARSAWMASCVFLPKSVLCQMGTLPRGWNLCAQTLLNSEGWDVVDKLPSFLTLCGDNSEACPQGGSPAAELSPNCPQR